MHSALHMMFRHDILRTAYVRQNRGNLCVRQSSLWCATQKAVDGRLMSMIVFALLSHRSLKYTAETAMHLVCISAPSCLVRS